MKLNHIAELRGLVKDMRSHTIHNYALPGLSSSLLTKGKLRLFEASRHTRELIVPHSHRFDFLSIVLDGSVDNTLYVQSSSGYGDCFAASILSGSGLGEYDRRGGATVNRYVVDTQTYSAGTEYFMRSYEIHSITFSKDAKVLIIEGPQVSNTSVILEPYVNGKHIPTFKVEDWMFEHEPS